MKDLYIAEKPSVAAEFAKALKLSGARRKGYIESEKAVVTWCVGHLVTMSYPEKYDPALKRWSLESLPFLPKTFLYEVIGPVKEQFAIVKEQLNRQDVGCIYICTDSGREGEYIYRLVDAMAQVKDKQRKRVWIDSQTEEEILRGIQNAKDWSAYDNLSASAYLRAKEDYLMGINFSRLLTLKYGNYVANFLKTNRAVLSVGRVMTCVLGMVVRREREIREFQKTPFFRLVGEFAREELSFPGEWRVCETSKYFQSPALYKDNGFKKREDAAALQRALLDYGKEKGGEAAVVFSVQKKQESKNPPLLYNLAELQNECAKGFKISPDETLKIVQGLYEKKMVTYPRTDARVLSSAVAKEIEKNISGLKGYPPVSSFADWVLTQEKHRNIEKSRYVNDSQITDHYAIIPTGFGLNNLNHLEERSRAVYELICRRFLGIFYPPARYVKYQILVKIQGETFAANFKRLKDPGYLAVQGTREKGSEEGALDPGFFVRLDQLKKGDALALAKLEIKEGETSPPKRYTSGSMILAMENAGQLIEDEELRSHMKGSGIGTSATRAEILKKLFTIRYLALNKKTQIITPTLFGETVYEVVDASLKQLLNPELTASWEKGLTMVAAGEITADQYMEKLDHFVGIRCENVKRLNNQYMLKDRFAAVALAYG